MTTNPKNLSDWNHTHFLDAWSHHTSRFGMTYPLPERWQTKLTSLMACGLPLADLKAAIDKTVRNFQPGHAGRPVGDAIFALLMSNAFVALAAHLDDDTSAMEPFMADRPKAAAAVAAHDPAWASMGPIVRKATTSLKNPYHDVGCACLVEVEAPRYETAATIPDGAVICEACRPDLIGARGAAA